MVSRKPGSPKSRECGGCNVCCTAMRVTPLKKPAGEQCAHQTERGCGIYARRPEVCRVWYCMWVRDNGRVFADHHRPDRLGVFFTASTPDPQSGAQTIYAHEVHAHAASTPEPQHVIHQLAHYAPVQILPAPDASGQRATPLTCNGQIICDV